MLCAAPRPHASTSEQQHHAGCHRHRRPGRHRQRDPLGPHQGRERRLSRPPADSARHPACRGPHGAGRGARDRRRRSTRCARATTTSSPPAASAPPTTTSPARRWRGPSTCPTASTRRRSASWRTSTGTAGRELNEARMRMAHTPEGAALIENPVSRAPGFRVENVHVLAGIPAVMRAMFESVAPTLKGGRTVKSREIAVLLGEGDVAARLEGLQERYPSLEIGSYPFVRDGNFGTTLVLRGTDEGEIAEAGDELCTILRELGGEPESPPRAACAHRVRGGRWRSAIADGRRATVGRPRPATRHRQSRGVTDAIATPGADRRLPRGRRGGRCHRRRSRPATRRHAVGTVPLHRPRPAAPPLRAERAARRGCSATSTCWCRRRTPAPPWASSSWSPKTRRRCRDPTASASPPCCWRPASCRWPSPRR